MALERVIFNNLLNNEEYARKVIPFLKQEYFTDYSEQEVYNLINNYVQKYNTFPTKEALFIDLSNKENVNEAGFKSIKEVIDSIDLDSKQNVEWLVDQTEKFCQEKAIYNGIMTSIKILDDKTGKVAKGKIPQILSDALAVSFDNRIGHDYFEDSESRYEFYHRKETRIPFDLEFFNKITKGGIPKKTLNVALAGTGVGKSLFMCHAAAANLMSGYNVLYITLEMAEERIAERIDANILDIPLDELASIPKEMFMNKINRLKSKKKLGKLVIREYPTSCAGVDNFRYLLNELKIKKNFVPDILYIDYLNICSSSRIRHGANVNSYTYIKAIAEELRGLAVEYNLPIITATQTTRSGYSSSDVELTDTSESFGLPATADMMFALISTEELQELGQIMVKQLKNRYADPNFNKRFVIGVDRSKMRLYDTEQSSQEDIMDGPVMDSTPFGEEDNERSKPKSKFKKDIFNNFK